MFSHDSWRRKRSEVRSWWGVGHLRDDEHWSKRTNVNNLGLILLGHIFSQDYELFCSSSFNPFVKFLVYYPHPRISGTTLGDYRHWLSCPVCPVSWPRPLTGIDWTLEGQKGKTLWKTPLWRESLGWWFDTFDFSGTFPPGRSSGVTRVDGRSWVTVWTFTRWNLPAWSARK